MLRVYPFASGSLYTSSYAITSSYADSASLAAYTQTASKADTILKPRSGSRGKSICLLTTTQYFELSASINTPPTKYELCNFG